MANKKTPVKPIEEYQISWWGYVLAYIPKLISLAIGLYITKFILYDQCLLNTNCNIVVTIFFALVALFCFDACGMPIGRFMNVVIKNFKEAKP